MRQQEDQATETAPPKSKHGDLILRLLALHGLVLVGFLVFKFIDPDYFPPHVEMAVFFTPLGTMLVISGVGLLDVNRNKTGNFVSSAPYAGKVEGLTRRQALFFNGLLIVMGLAIIAAGIVLYLLGPRG